MKMTPFIKCKRYRLSFPACNYFKNCYAFLEICQNCMQPPSLDFQKEDGRLRFRLVDFYTKSYGPGGQSSLHNFKEFVPNNRITTRRIDGRNHFLDKNHC